MRKLLNIILACCVIFTAVGANQYSTKSRHYKQQTQVTDTRDDNTSQSQEATKQDSKKQDPKKQEVPAPRPKEEKKKTEVPAKASTTKGDEKKDKDKKETTAAPTSASEKTKADEPAKAAEKPKPVVNMQYDGIDVSRHQKTINWELLARDKNIKYVYIKATEGQSFVDPKFRENLENARKAGFKVGCYHFLRTGSRIQDQFENFTRQVKKNEQDLLPLLDVEVKQGWTNQQLRDSVKLFVDLLEEHYGCKPMIYTSSSFFNNILGRAFAEYPLFIARYAANEPVLENGAKWILWQFSDRGQLRGIDHAVDLGRFNKGCSVRDILIKDNKIEHHHRRSSEVVDRSHEKSGSVNVKKEAPTMSKKQEAELKKQQEREQKARERQEKLAKEDAKKREEQARKEQKEMERRKAREKAVRQRVETNFTNSSDQQKQAENAEKEARKREKAEKQAAKEREKAEKAAREKAAREKAAQEKAERDKAERDKQMHDKAVKKQMEREAAQKAQAEKREKAQARAVAEQEKDKQEKEAREAKQQKRQQQKEKLQQQKQASTTATPSTSKTTTKGKRTNKSSADND